MFQRVRVRQLLIGGSGVLFGFIAIAAAIAPDAVAKQYGLTITGVDAHNQFRAVFVGFWSALAALMITAARRPELRVLGDLCALALVLQAGGRLLSVVVDGVPSMSFLGAMVLEAAAGAIALWARPPAA